MDHFNTFHTSSIVALAVAINIFQFQYPSLTFLYEKNLHKLTFEGFSFNDFCSFFIVGTVYYVDDKGRAAECFKADGAVKFLLYSEGKDVLVVVTEGLILSQHRVAHDGSTTEVAKVDRNDFSFMMSMNNSQTLLCRIFNLFTMLLK